MALRFLYWGNWWPVLVLETVTRIEAFLTVQTAMKLCFAVGNMQLKTTGKVGHTANAVHFHFQMISVLHTILSCE